MSPATEQTQPALPPHAKVKILRFDNDAATLHLVLDDSTERAVLAAEVRAFVGVRLHHDTWAAPEAYDPAGDEVHRMVVSPTHKNIWQPVLGIDVSTLPEALYITLNAFNYREALNADAELITRANIPKLLDRLAAFCPHAKRDEGFEALRVQQEPPPLENIRQLFALLRPEAQA